MSTSTRAYRSTSNSMNSAHTTSNKSSDTSLKKLKPSHTHLVPIEEYNCTIIQSLENPLIVQQQIECKECHMHSETKHENIQKYSQRMSISVDQHLPLLPPTNVSEHTNNPHSLEKECFIANGYIRLNKICDTLQGSMFHAKLIDTGNEVVIKKTDKTLYDKRISIQDGMNVIVEENIIKEAIILHHLTVDNKATNDYIVRFSKFFESDDAFYLVMEKAGNMNLAQFNAKAHQLIDEKKLKLKNWKKIVKFVFWQLSAIIYWLHHDMKCCHLELNLTNVMVSGDFIENKEDGTYTVDPNLKIKLIDFGLSEIFETGEDFEEEHEPGDEYFGNPFECGKHGITDKHYLSAPKVFGDNPYDARKCDMWSLGIMLYQLATGLEPYKSPHINDKAFYMVKHGEIMALIEKNDNSKHVNAKMVNLMCNLLVVREKERYNCCDVLQDEWLGLYYSKYKVQIVKKSQHQILRNKQMKGKMEIFPYYKAAEF